MGNNAPTSMPIFMASCSAVMPHVVANEITDALFIATSVMIPTSCGPTDAPQSPPAAIKAKIKIPPLGYLSDATIKLPGQSIETQNPVIAQPMSPTMAKGEKAATK